MNNLIGDLGVNILGGLLTAFILLGIGGAFGFIFGRKKYKLKYKSAPKVYVRKITNAINLAANDVRRSKDPADSNIIVRARVIVSTRDAVRESLIAITRMLNSDIDKLSVLVDEAVAIQRSGQRLPSNLVSQISANVMVLNGVWDNLKEDQIKNEIAKLLTELGLVES